jgi:UDP-N-acetylmuramoyl-L-alanyl-D-glutamate--2,6-diaminopimelate ligase
MDLMAQPQYDFDAIFDELLSADLAPKILRRPANHFLVEAVTADSRKTDLGTIFCAIKGGVHDGHTSISENSDRLSIVVVESPPEGLAGDVHSSQMGGAFGVIHVASTRAAWAQLASLFAGHPSRQLKMIGITGTNGKTSCAWMVKGLLDTLKVPCASIGTLGFHCGQVYTKSLHTTPDPDALYPSLRALVNQGVQCVVMEVSSHSLVQGKVWPIVFEAAAFTSFSQDHLDFHADMESYLAAKMCLFTRHLSPRGFALFHDSVAALGVVRTYLSKITALSALKKTYGAAAGKPDYRVVANSYYAQGLSIVCLGEAQGEDAAKCEIPMVGDVFCENFAASLILASKVCARSLAEMSKALAAPDAIKILPVPGRLELISDERTPWRPLVYVDYAHTPDALQKAIENLSQSGRKRSIVTTVFGCGGERDRSKRPVMGEIAARLSKRVIVTSDNPRREDAEAIVNEVYAGTKEFANVSVILDRREAISSALAFAGARDVVLIAGKGHENYQLIGTKSLHFSDQEEASKTLLAPRTWLVFGAGVSGFAAASHLEATGEHVYLCDDKAIAPPLGFSPRIHVITFDQIPWAEVWTVLVSPGIPLSHNVVTKARALLKDVITEIDLGFNRYMGSILAVTGTNGKSTTVMMAEFLCRELKISADACGNIGLPPTSLNLRAATSDHVSVVELSSYQLEGSSPWPARCAAITSFSIDHLARHKTMGAYFAAKWRVTEWLTEESLFIATSDVLRAALEFNASWPTCRSVVIGCSPAPSELPQSASYIRVDGGECVVEGQSIDFRSLNIFGHHNHVNALTAALMVSNLTNRPPSSLLPLVARYKPLPYRCEIIFDDGLRKIVNDSKSTNLESTVAALSIAGRPAILLMGGQGKGESYVGLRDMLAVLKHMVVFGASREAIAKDAPVPAVIFEKMRDAVLHALEIARDNQWDIIFSPGCASFDEFNNFEHRGDVFNALVTEFNVRNS